MAFSASDQVFTEQLSPNKQPVVIYKRSNRFFRKDAAWFYQTREGVDMGPFADKAEAQMALVYFIERTTWPDPKQLRNYISARCG
ncbi:MAG: DUF6316 family protein [Pseudomonadales bacterium]